MIKKNTDIIYNEKHLVIVPASKKELLKAFDNSFKNVVFLDNNIEDTYLLINFINRSNFKQLVFVDYEIDYEQIIDKISQEHEISFIFTESLASFSDSYIYGNFKKIYDLCKKKDVSKLALLDRGLYESLKNKFSNLYFIKLDNDYDKYNVTLEYDENSIGIINIQNKNTHSFYNELSALSLIPDSNAKLIKPNRVTKKFVKMFNINYETFKDSDSLIKGNLVNLYINFTENNPIKFLESMDNGVPCLLGNCDILEGNDYLKKMLVMKSDDDANEIAEKIIAVKQNRDKIMKEYLKFRSNYSALSKKTINDFLGFELEKIPDKANYPLLLSVIVPVYNTEKYLEKSLKSIIKAKIKNMEILVINDGSSDNSEKIILKYQKKYPELIKYIRQENHGLGNVRNVGLKNAKGKYIASVDSDDTIDKKLFSDALKYMKKDIDIIMCDWMTVTNDSSYSTDAIDYIFKNINQYEGLLYTTIMPSTCNKIIKKSLFDELKIQYIEDKYEDLSTNPFIMLRANTIKYINKPYYKYYIRSNSIMRSSPGYSMMDVLKIFNERLKKYKNNINIDIDKFKYYTFAWRIEEYVINQLYTIDEKYLDDFTKYLDENFKDICVDIFNNSYYKDRICSLSIDKQKYIEKRNQAIIENEIKQFIIKHKKDKSYIKLTPPIMYYGDNSDSK